MLKRSRQFAHARLPHTATHNHAVAHEGSAISRVTWPGVRAVDCDALWLCIHLPSIALEALGITASPAAAIIVEQGTKLAVLTCNATAQRQGIYPGLALNAARALCPELDVRQRDERAEAALMDRLAQWALACTPVVSVVAECNLLLEVAGSLRLYDGLENLRQQLQRQLHERGHDSLMACAPTPRAALWLSTAERQQACLKKGALPQLLAALPLQVLGWPDKTRRQLKQMGIDTVADCIRLPRDGFARRIGKMYLLELDQALGRQPQLLSYYRAPERFRAVQELNAESLDAAIIDRLAVDLLEQLEQFLRRRQAAVQRVSLQLMHHARPSTCVPLMLREPCSQVSYLHDLLQLQLDKLELSAPVTGIALEATALTANREVNFVLPGIEAGTADAGRQRWIQLVERLRARLGERQVYGVGLVAEHRPEFAWQAAAPETMPAAAAKEIHPAAGQGRPLWLLDQPRRLAGPPGHAADRSLHAAERIETGWWDCHDVRRDYYTIAGPAGSRWWVYKDHHDSAWYLHGLFG